MQLREAIKDLDIVETKCDLNTEVSDIKYDSREVERGDIFVCIKGFKTDGHKYISDAYKKGASVFIVQDDVNFPAFNIIKVKDTRKALAKLAANLFSDPSEDFTLIGVTGTNGKTTVTNIIKDILESLGNKTGLIGTINTVIGDEVIESKHTTPEATDLQRIFRHMADKSADYVVMEVSSHSLVLNRVDSCKFDIALFTNLTQDHLDFHKTMENYVTAKTKLFKMAKHGIVNNDDKYADYFKRANNSVMTYGIENRSDVTASSIVYTNTGVMFDLSYGGKSYKVSYHVPGKFSVYNTLAAISVLILCGYDLSSALDAIKNFKGVKGRCEVVNVGKEIPYSIIIDYAHTPDGLENILKAAKGFTEKRLILVFGCGGDRDTTKRPLMGAIAQKYSDYTVVTSDNPRTEDPNKIIDDILKGIDDRKKNYCVIPDRTTAIKHALFSAGKGDTVLLAGKGHETYQILGTEKIHFDEREIVKNILED